MLALFIIYLLYIKSQHFFQNLLFYTKNKHLNRYITTNHRKINYDFINNLRFYHKILLDLSNSKFMK